jgi:myosin-5
VETQDAMAAAYAKGTRVWLPDQQAGWVPGIVVSLSPLPIPENADPTTELTLTVAMDGEPDEQPRVLKFHLASLLAATAGDAASNNVHPTTPPPGQDLLPPLRNPPLLESSEDLASLSNLNEPSGECNSYLRSDI